jgi:hypothetical protein
MPKIRTVFGTVEVKNPRWMLCQRCLPHTCMVFTVLDGYAGRLFWTYTTLTRATEAAARCGAIDTTTCATASSVQTYAVQQAWGINDVTSSTFTVTNPGCGVQVEATYMFQSIIPWFDPLQPFGNANTLTLNTTACYPSQTS